MAQRAEQPLHQVPDWLSPYQIVTYPNAAIYSGTPLYYSLDIAWDPGRPA
jgi:hypothetical protein